jgi:hypothetical protein
MQPRHFSKYFLVSLFVLLFLIFFPYKKTTRAPDNKTKSASTNVSSEIVKNKKKFTLNSNTETLSLFSLNKSLPNQQLLPHAETKPLLNSEGETIDWNGFEIVRIGTRFISSSDWRAKAQKEEWYRITNSIIFDQTQSSLHYELSQQFIQKLENLQLMKLFREAENEFGENIGIVVPYDSNMPEIQEFHALEKNYVEALKNSFGEDWSKVIIDLRNNFYQETATRDGFVATPIY